MAIVIAEKRLEWLQLQVMDNFSGTHSPKTELRQAFQQLTTTFFNATKKVAVGCQNVWNNATQLLASEFLGEVLIATIHSCSLSL